ncbi:G protein-coupled receptor rhodopsin-like [Trinorchestia longiramus]|nr:G protein-coupled receptor rhodopsin-like [Trinorchestia longiramus]
MSSAETPTHSNEDYTLAVLNITYRSLIGDPTSHEQNSDPSILFDSEDPSQNLIAASDVEIFLNASNTSDFNFTNTVDGNLSKKLSNFTEEIWLHASWWGLAAILVLLLTALGNLFVILAISWERRLQNMTNYFLMSLAVTDLMVALLVMPFAIVELTIGRFPFTSEWCLTWICLDVLFCTASIMHLCTISVDRFLSLRYPMKFGRNKTCRRVLLKLVFVWCLSLACSLPLSLMYATDSETTIATGMCQIPASLFQIIGSVICFYIPLIIMIATYALTVRLLSVQKTELLKKRGVKASGFGSQKSVKMKKFSCRSSCIASESVRASAGSSLSDLPTDDMRTREVTDILEETDAHNEEKCHFERGSLRRSLGSYCSPSGPRRAQARTRKYSSSSRSDDDPPCVELTIIPSNRGLEAESVRYTHPGSSPKLCRSNSPKIVISSSTSQHELFEPRELEKLLKTDGNGTHHSKPFENEPTQYISPEPALNHGFKYHSHSHENIPACQKYSKTNSSSNDLVKICDSSGLEQSFLGRCRSDEPQRTGGRQCDSPSFNGTPVAVPCSCAPRFFLEGFDRTAPTTEGKTGAISSHIVGTRPSLRPSPSVDSSATWSRCCPCCAAAEEGSAELASLESPWQEDSFRHSATAEMVARLVHRSGFPVTRVIRKFGTGNNTDSGNTSTTNTNTNNTPVHYPHLRPSPTLIHHHTHQPNMATIDRRSNMAAADGNSNMAAIDRRSNMTAMDERTYLEVEVRPTDRNPGIEGNHTQAESISRGLNRTTSKLWRAKSTPPALKMSSSKKHGRNIKMEQKATKVLGIVFFTFVVLWSPFFIMNVLTVICPTCASYVPGDVMSFVTWLGYISSTVNPFFYTFFNKTFRDAFWKIATCQMKPFRKYHRYHR